MSGLVDPGKQTIEIYFNFFYFFHIQPSKHQLRDSLANIYAISDPSILKLKFDGEVVGDEDSPESLDLEDEDMIDILVS
jgi:hypothetical protein